MSFFSLQPQPTSNWYAATTHYLTGGLVMPIIITGVIAYVLSTFLKIENNFLNTVIGYTASLFALWLGILYSVNYLNKSYIITDKLRVVKISTVFYLIASAILIVAFYFIDLLYSIAVWLQGRGEVEHLTKTNDLIIMSIVFIIEAYIFYLLSKKYLRA